MPLTIAEEEWLSDLLDHASEYWGLLSTWERNFVTDLRQRYELEGSLMILSSRMRECLVRIQDKAP